MRSPVEEIGDDATEPGQDGFGRECRFGFEYSRFYFAVVNRHGASVWIDDPNQLDAAREVFVCFGPES